MNCSKQIMTVGLNFNRLRQCKNHAVEGSEFCNTHQPGKVKPVADPGKERYKTLLFAAGLRNRRTI